MGATQLADPQHTGPQGRRSQCAGAWRGSMIQLTAEFEGSPIVRSRPSRFLSVVRKTVTRRARAGPLDNRASPRQQVDAGKRDGLVTLVTYSAGVRSRAGRSTQDSAAPTGSGVGGDPSLSHDE